MQTLTKLTIGLLLLSAKLFGQNSEINPPVQHELKMTFPSIYFKHNSTDYAFMPYSVDSCFKHIALQFNENINSLVIWKDTAELESLTTKRIKKLKLVLKTYLPNKEFEIFSMGNEQKVSRHTINMLSDSSNINYLLSLNSVFDISKTRLPNKTIESHILHPNIFCKSCWKNGFHLNKRGQEVRKIARRTKQDQKPSKKKKQRRHLVWTGWKTGLHWSTAK